MTLRHSKLLPLVIALTYSILLFFIANYLPIITNGLAEILTWEVYSKIVRGLVIFLGAVMVFIIFVRISLIPKPLVFLAQLAVFAAITWRLFGKLGDSVNEYIHYPQYAVCVIVWFAALTSIRREPPNKSEISVKQSLMRFPIIPAMIISAMLGLAEEGYQYFAPRRAFDIQDILLNMMGVWLGAVLIWVTRNKQKDLT